MARYKPYDYRQTKMLPVSYERQILPGTFEHTLSELVDHEIDLKVFESGYRNDDTGAPAYDPAILLKVILFGYSKGITSSREIARLCRENVLFMALSADSQPHFTTIADFIARLDGEITKVFRDVLLVCDEAGLIGKEMFAVDGVKLPSNAAKEWSGTQQEYSRKIEKMQRAAGELLARHRETDDGCDETPAMQAAREKQARTLQRAIEKVRGFLQRHEDKVGARGKVRQSNITDNESAKMPSSKGVIQGYTAVALVDGHHQIVLEAQAFGEGQEHGLLIPMIEGARRHFRTDPFAAAAVLADAGYCSEANAKYLSDEKIDGYLADPQMRKRDARFAQAERFRPTRPDEPFAKAKRPSCFQPKDFQIAADHSHAICPAGKRLYRNGRHCNLKGYEAIRFRGAQRDCGSCALRAQCLRHPERSVERQVALIVGRVKGKPETYCARMKRKIDSDVGRYRYSRRLGIVEPVFANIRSTHRLSRFSHRGKHKVTTQWRLYCLVHNIGKLQRYGGLLERRRSK
jgi:transposase